MASSAAASNQERPRQTTIDERRSQCVLGDLPEDFLQLQPPQVAADAQTAYSLQAQQWGAVDYPQYKTVGQLDITITQAKLSKNYGITRMDSYCRIRVGHQIYETPTSYSSAKNPRWNKRFSCQLPRGVDSFYVEIYDEKTFSVDDRVAWAHVTFPAAIFNGDTSDDWYSLSGKLGNDKEGMVNIIMSYREIQVPSQPPLATTTFIPQAYNTTYFQPPVVQHPAPGQPIPPSGQPMSPQQPLQPSQNPVEVTDEDVKAVGELFPAVDEEVVRSVLEEKAGDKEAAINALLQMT